MATSFFINERRKDGDDSGIFVSKDCQWSFGTDQGKSQMRLVTPYAPTTFLKPCIVIDTVYNEGSECETAVLFNEALNANHALAFHSDDVRKVEEITGRKKISEWSVVKKHESEQEAIDYHLSLAKQLHNGGSEEQWSEGMDLYLELYDKYCPTEMRDRFDAKGAA